MYHSTQLTTGSPSARNSLNRSSWRPDLLLIPLALAWFALSPAARAVDPPPDGGYPNANTAEGTDALFSVTSGFDNTAVGFETLFGNTTGSANTATGWTALQNNATGFNNTADGSNSLARNTTGINNTATGEGALFLNTTGSQNTAHGVFALSNNIDASQNTAAGFEALIFNTGGSNTAVGYEALLNNTIGGNNIALGASAGENLTTGSNNIEIGAPGKAGESGQIRIGRTGLHTQVHFAGIFGGTVPGGVTVIADQFGRLGTVSSSARFKDQIKPMDKASESILALQPVTFTYKEELDPDRIPQFGLVAEQVEKVNPDLVARDDQGKPYTVRYEAVNAMLLNEFLKGHRKGEQQERTIAKLEAQLAQQQNEIQGLTAGLKEQASQIQQVSNRFAAEQSAPQVVANNQ
jgi:uncharacterized coiled-coil protein SlyX